MALKNKILETLEKNRGSSVSGEALAKEAGVTRAAVWKGIKSLESEGYKIKATKNKGYMLDINDPGISEEGIRLYFRLLEKEGFSGKEWETEPEIYVFDVLDSTQNFGKKLAAENKPERAVIAADSQTAGKGRYGKSFYSPKSTGVYMSLVIKVKRKVRDFLSITFMTAVSVTRVIERHSKTRPLIKWVNDIWIGNKKAVGILTEAVSDFESGMLEYVIIGIGINITTEDYPEEIKDTACSISDMDISRNRLIAEVADEVFSAADTLLNDPCGAEKLLREYKEKSLVLGKRICWTQNKIVCKGTVSDINSEGNLVVETENGTKILNSGEISVRPDEATF